LYSLAFPSLTVISPLLFAQQAVEDNEMNLTEGEVIEQIEELDEGWWSGVGGGGAKAGMFPGPSGYISVFVVANSFGTANYVEIVEQPEGQVEEDPAPPPPPPPPPVRLS
jgi:hypothetical protein